MANYAASIIRDGQAFLTESYAKAEMRFADPVVWKNLLSGNELSNPSNDLLRTREDRSYSAEQFIRNERALGTGRSHTHSFAKSDSAIITPTFATVNDGFYTSMKQAGVTTTSRQEQFNNELNQVMLNYAKGMESLATSWLFAGKSAVNGVTAEGTFNGTTDVFEISAATEGDRSMQITNSTMDLLNYQGGRDIYCDTISYNKFAYMYAQGAGNNINTNFQFNRGEDTFFHVPALNAAADGLSYTKGYWQVIPKGMSAAMDWIPLENRQGVPSQSIGGVAEFGSIINPIDGASYAVHKIWSGGDETAKGGMTQDVTEDIEISIDYSFNLAPLSGGAGETPNLAFGLV